MGRMADPEVPAGRSGADVWIRRIVVGLVVIVVAFIGFQMLSAYAPRSWAQHIGRRVNGNMSDGIMWGLFYGAVFTFVSVLVAAISAFRWVNWAWKAILIVLALAISIPNWLTLWVVVGTSRAAHAGERILDVDAPGFRAATVAGVAGGAILALAIVTTVAMSRRRKSQIRDLKGQLADRDAPPPAPADRSPEKEPPHA